MKKKHWEQLLKEAQANGHESFATYLIDTVNKIGEEQDGYKANLWFDSQVTQVYKEERHILVNAMHNHSKEGIKGIAFIMTADILFSRLFNHWYD